ncbi:MAG: hypothetical protein A2W61_06660 [Deltaproteobacteria bacterium RIFCSPLOWO2_01_44_7]|nr:MAG: hypothetical protein A2712_05370 [Deltaproteobacteria bacterium RIFCSPHIGHO2_01_FULL_43_49]OGQ38820.1 MAG: hypothetical protein A2W61_06660 [Deltaproteobacteria bacterium RIFCSPLOWO2_01_44_7]OGQ42489.1 MAG: hypothetical protein A3I70_10950 [Deltaproteobacteria bacterium RIFCSPLOWO2_02_FULL_44_34]
MKLLKYALVMAISIQLFIACDPRGGPGQSSGPQQPGGDQVTPPPPVSGGVSVAPDVAPDDEAVITDSGVGIPAPQNKGPEIRFPYLGIHYTEPPLKDSNGEAFLMPGSIQDLEIDVSDPDQDPIDQQKGLEVIQVIKQNDPNSNIDLNANPSAIGFKRISCPSTYQCFYSIYFEDTIPAPGWTGIFEITIKAFDKPSVERKVLPMEGTGTLIVDLLQQ